MYTLFVTIDVHADKIDEFIDVMTVNATASLRDEPGCLAFDVHQDTATPTRFYLYEVYTDEEAFMVGHRGAPHYARWQEAAKTLVVDGGQSNAFARSVHLGEITGSKA